MALSSLATLLKPGVKSLQDMQRVGYLAMRVPNTSFPEDGMANPDAGIFKYWAKHKEVGVPITGEYPIRPEDGGGVAVVTATGQVLHWTAGEDVKVV